jgi:ElaB/YqjD/DUF883 family membrane-anchored ribosome-binding protein
MDDRDPKNSESRDPGAGKAEKPGEASFWEEARSKGKNAGRRLGEGWDEVSGSAREYADEHSIGVALGSLGVGLAVGLLLGLLISRD